MEERRRRAQRRAARELSEPAARSDGHRGGRAATVTRCRKPGLDAPAHWFGEATRRAARRRARGGGPGRGRRWSCCGTRTSSPFAAPDECTATVDGHTVSLDVEQAENAALITAIAVGRGLPARAASIALATAYQESDLRNLECGDRDSLGLFQQRPSQGWGDAGGDPRPGLRHQRLLRRAREGRRLRVDGDHRGRPGRAALGVPRGVRRPRARRPGPRLGADRQLAARRSAAASAASPTETDAELTDSGLTARADDVRRESSPTCSPTSRSAASRRAASRRGHMEGSAHYEGRADRRLRPAGQRRTNRARGWAIAHYLVSQADRLRHPDGDLRRPDLDGAGRSDDGWRDYDPPERSGDPAILEHRDHVHVDVYR